MSCEMFFSAWLCSKIIITRRKASLLYETFNLISPIREELLHHLENVAVVFPTKEHSEGGKRDGAWHGVTRGRIMNLIILLDSALVSLFATFILAQQIRPISTKMTDFWGTSLPLHCSMALLFIKFNFTRVFYGRFKKSVDSSANRNAEHSEEQYSEPENSATVFETVWWLKITRAETCKNVH